MAMIEMRRKEEMIRDGVRLEWMKDEVEYRPIGKNFRTEGKLSQIIHGNKKKYICSRDEIKKMSILSE